MKQSFPQNILRKFFEFNGEVKRQKSGTAIGAKFAPPYAYIFVDEVETEFLKSQELQPFLWLRYIDDIFFIWTHGEEKLTQFLNELNNFHFNLKFTYQTSSCTVNLLEWKLEQWGNTYRP